MTRHRRTRPRRADPSACRHGTVFGLLALLGSLIVSAGAVRAQAPDCIGLRAALDAARRDDDAGRVDTALRQQRDEIARLRDRAEDSGCGGDADDPGSAECRGLARRLGQLETGVQRLEDQASRDAGAAADRRRALTEQFDADCPADGAAPFRPADAPDETTTMPVDPDAHEPGAAPAPASPARVAQVYCVRHCDGAYYPLAVDVASDRLGDMDRICQAQCPAAESSAYANGGSEDVAQALASDGTAYSALAAAFRFRTATTPTCACRAPRQSWAEALAGAEALLEQRKGDVTVTPALATAMARPVAPPAVGTPSPKPVVQKAPAAARPATPRGKTARRPIPVVPPPPDPAAGPDTALDLTREFRRAAPLP